MQQIICTMLITLVALANPILGLVNDLQAADVSKHKFAIILPGPVEDADYNFRGYQVSQFVQEHFGMSASHSERISPADAERVAREYIATGYTIIAFHGGQYFRVVQKLAPKFPAVSFIMESSGSGTIGDNVWNIQRRFNEGFYAIGALAGLATRTNKVGVIAGIQLPDWRAAINSVSDALKATNPQATLVYAFTGHQNDPVKARQTAEVMIADDVDFLISLVNLGVYGVVEAAKNAKQKILLTTFYTDKTDKAPEHFAASLVLDFRPLFQTAVEGILNGTTGGYIPMRPGSGFELTSIRNVPPEVGKQVEELFLKVGRGEITPRNELETITLAQ